MAKSIKKLQVVIPGGEVLFDEGHSSKEMYILLRGEVEILKGGRRLALINSNGSFIGEMATLLDAPRTAKVQTTTKSVFLKVEPEDVDVLFKVTPELGYNLSKSLAERLAIMTDKVAELAQGGSLMSEEEPANDKLSPQDISEADEAMEKEDELPGGGWSEKMEFLTRTEVHKDVFRYWFNHVGMEMQLEAVLDDFECPPTLMKLILVEFRTAELITIDDGVVNFLFVEEFQPVAEDWVLDHGLFRSVS
jgi:CRP-like cAMP-binding protein